MSDSLTLILSLLLAIPVGIATNLITPRIRQLLATGNAALRQEIENRRARETAFIEWLAQVPEARIAHFTNQRGQILLGMVGFFGCYVSIIIVAQTSEYTSWLSRLPIVASTLLIAYLAYRLNGAIRKYRRIWYGVLRRTAWIDWDFTVWSTADERWVPIASNAEPEGGQEFEHMSATTDLREATADDSSGR